MLRSLSIRNFALIEESNIDFNSGFSVITGETGAGKSIILGALGMLLGQKADVGSLKNPNEKCVVEACFDVSKYCLNDFFEQNEIDYDDECIIRREISPAGKSRAFVNDSPVNISVLKQLGDYLVDIHSQHQNLLISNSDFQLSVLDVVAESADALSVYKAKYSEFKADSDKLKNAISAASRAQNDLDFIQFQFKQLEDAKLVVGEQTELEQEQSMLQNAESIKESLSKSQWLLDGDEHSVVCSLKESLAALNESANTYPKLEDVIQRINSAYIDLKDVAHEIDGMMSDVEANPDRLNAVNDRLDLIYSLQHKHKVESVEDLVKIRDSFKKQLSDVENSDEFINELKQQVEKDRKELTKMADSLSDLRSKQAPELQTRLDDILHQLGMPNASLKIDMQKNDNFGPNGVDLVSFLFSANKDKNFQPISNIASGGEMARVMLSLKFILSESKNLPTIIFDEIDTGVSGDIASKMGSIMQQMGRNMQVVSITHLPQIAAKGAYQYKVYKTDSDVTTSSHITLLNDDERVTFIAKLLSGDKVTDAAIQNAKELLRAN